VPDRSLDVGRQLALRNGFTPNAKTEIAVRFGGLDGPLSVREDAGDIV
jgi:hypothetical protein